MSIFYLSKCSRIENCNRRDEQFIAAGKIVFKSLKQYETLEFEQNLADLYWQDSIASFFDVNQPKNFSLVPFSNKYLYADVAAPIENSTEKDSVLKSPLFERYKSNEIILEKVFKTN